MAKKNTANSQTEWNYAASPESTSHIRLEKKYQLFINNEWVAPSSKKYFPTINPATEDVLAEIAWANDADVDLAVKAARKAYEQGPWSKMTPGERGRLLYKLADAIEENIQELAARYATYFSSAFENTLEHLTVFVVAFTLFLIFKHIWSNESIRQS